ncbi:MAG: phage terminase small subunit-related protein [Oscillospiraceae bacterium]
MPKARSENRDRAYEFYKDHGGKITNRAIADQLGISEKTVGGWKCKDKWDDKLNGVLRKTKRSTPKENKPRGAPKGSKSRRLPERALCSRKVLNNLLQDAKYREAFWGKPTGAVQPPALNVEQFNQVRSTYDLPPIRVYDRVARIQNEDGSYTSIRLLAQDKFILLPGGKLGDFLHGVPTEALYNNDLQGTEKQGVYTYNYSEHEPPAIYTKTVMFAFPTFPEAEHVFQADVL